MKILPARLRSSNKNNENALPLQEVETLRDQSLYSLERRRGMRGLTFRAGSSRNRFILIE